MTAIDTDVRVRGEMGRVRSVPAEAGIWVFVALDVLIFGWMFVLYAYQRAEHPVVFHAASDVITPAFGLIYTVLLLTSSWFIVTAIGSLRRHEHQVAERCINLGIGFGAAFAVLKVVEYSIKFAHGYLPVTNQFLMFYFVLTFVHFLHASGGLIALGFVRNQIRRSAENGQLPRQNVQLVEAAGIFWHMVDLLWIFLFALFYLGK
ncbi:MAG: cytochrome c oxidase subunit 3 [Aeromicrobium sp.]